MRLSTHTDYSLRILMYLARQGQTKRVTTPALASIFKVSQNHLHKVVQTLRRLEVVKTTHGVNGGITLNKHPSEIRIGSLARGLEMTGNLADCGKGPCPLYRACSLKNILDAAEESFFDYLDKFTLEDTLTMPTLARLGKLTKTPAR
jgi:Rrf2 family nitric oxide-sensitive transcriptional repressor